MSVLEGMTVRGTQVYKVDTKSGAPQDCGWIKAEYLTDWAEYEVDAADEADQSDDDAGAHLPASPRRQRPPSPPRTASRSLVFTAPRFAAGEEDDDEYELDDDSSEEDDESFDVERILAHRGSGKTRQYLVKWEGYGDDEATWEPAASLKGNLVLFEYLDLEALKSKA